MPGLTIFSRLAITRFISASILFSPSPGTKISVIDKGSDFHEKEEVEGA